MRWERRPEPTRCGPAGDDDVDGAAGADSIGGEAGNDLLNGGAANDTIDGGGDNDLIYGGGRGANKSSSGNDDLRGGLGNDTVLGGDGKDKLRGDAGNDVLFGEKGTDTIEGGAGNDTLVGGVGADELIGGQGSDTFGYRAVADSKASASRSFSSKTSDTISVFTSAAESSNAALRDKIDLRWLANAIGHSLGWKGTAGAKYGVWQTVVGKTTLVNIDTTGDGEADMVIKINSKEALKASDFLGLKTVDKAVPTVTGAAYGSNDGTLKAGETVTLSVSFSEAGLRRRRLALAGAEQRRNGDLCERLGHDHAGVQLCCAYGAGQRDLAISSIVLNGAIITDAWGNKAALADAANLNPAGTLAVDTAGPGAPNVALETGSSGISPNGLITVTPAEKGGTVQYSIDGGTTWSSSFVAVEGTNTVHVRQIDAAGNIGAATSFTFVRDTAAPNAPTVALTNDTGSSGSDKITSNGALTVTPSEAGGNVQYSTDGGTTWSSSFSAVEGANAVQVRQVDAAGNLGSATSFSFTLDTVATGAPVITGFAEDSGASGDGFTTDTTLAISGTAEAGTTVHIFDGATDLGTTTANGGGAWSFTTAALSTTAHSFTVTATDPAGNGDGDDDLVVGAPYADPHGASSGVGYVIFGGNFSGSVVFAGTSAADTLAGTDSAETFVGGQGNDTLIGTGGADAFQGGAGNDTIRLTGPTFADIDGGSGTDTVALIGSDDSFFFAVIPPAEFTSIEGHDAFFVPQMSYSTGDLDAHDLAAIDSGPPIFVNTLFNCLAQASPTHSFVPLWQPAFISRLAAEDRCHLNGLAMREGKPVFVTAVSDTDTYDSWRDHRGDGGIVIDVVSGEVVCRGLSMPHSPRWHMGKLWLHNSGSGEFGFVDLPAGEFMPVAFCPGYLRGLSFAGNFAVMGLSRPRENKTFAGLELDDRLKERRIVPRCGIYFVDLSTGSIVHSLTIEGVVSELYDVSVIPDALQPAALGPSSPELKRTISIGF